MTASYVLQLCGTINARGEAHPFVELLLLQQGYSA
jgi:hypothetical protein